MSIATLIRQMTEAGAPPEAIALAVEAIEAAQNKDQARRAAQRERTRRHREKADASRYGNVTVTPCNVTPPAPSSSSPTPPTTTTPPSGDERETREHVWPADWREQCWRAYGKRTGRKKGDDRLTLVYRADRLSFDVLLTGLRAATSSVSDPHFLPELERWLREERWNDEHLPLCAPAARSPPPVNGHHRPRSTADIATQIALEADENLRRKRNGNDPFDGEVILPFAARPSDPAARHTHAPHHERPGAAGGSLQPEGYPSLRIARR
jgi:hypothetical protein